MTFSVNATSTIGRGPTGHGATRSLGTSEKQCVVFGVNQLWIMWREAATWFRSASALALKAIQHKAKDLQCKTGKIV
jgi:hypothetical protein